MAPPYANWRPGYGERGILIEEEGEREKNFGMKRFIRPERVGPDNVPGSPCSSRFGSFGWLRCKLNDQGSL
jgi:hypothetical protein